MGATAGAIRAGRAFVELFADDSKMQAVLKRSQVRLLSFSDFVRTVGLRMASLGSLMTVPFIKATSDYAKFDDQMREVAGVVSATSDELDMLTKTARRLAQQRGTSFLATDIGALMAELGRSGFAAESVNRMTKSVLLLARATKTELPIASKITGSTLRQFNLGVEQTGNVTDLLAKTANASATSVESLGSSLEYAGKPAYDLGYSLQETLAIIGTLGNLGIVGTEAGTAIRRLGALTAAEADKMQSIFGVAFRGAKGQALPLIEVLERVSQSTEKLGSSDRMKKYNDAFGILGITSAIALGTSAKSARSLVKELDNVAGYAGRAAKRMDEGIGGSLRAMWASLFEDELSVGNALEKHLIPIIDKVTISFQQLAHWVQENPLTVTELGKTAVAIAATGAGLMGLGVTGGLAALNLRGIGYALHAALTPARLLSSALGGVLSVAHRAEKLSTSWAGLLMTNVMGGRRGKRGRTSQPKGSSWMSGGGSALSGLWGVAAEVMGRDYVPKKKPPPTAPKVDPLASRMSQASMFGHYDEPLGPGKPRRQQSSLFSRVFRRSLPKFSELNFRGGKKAAITSDFYRKFEELVGLGSGELVRSVRMLLPREASGRAFGQRYGKTVGRINGMFTRGNKQVALSGRTGTWQTVLHELGHAVDAKAGGGTYASKDMTHNFSAVLSRFLSRKQASVKGVSGDQAPHEKFARFFSKQGLPVQVAMTQAATGARVVRPSFLAMGMAALSAAKNFVGMRVTGLLLRIEVGLMRAQFAATRLAVTAWNATLAAGRAVVVMWQGAYAAALVTMSSSRVVIAGLRLAMIGLSATPGLMAAGITAMSAGVAVAAGALATLRTGWVLLRAAALGGFAVIRTAAPAAWTILKSGVGTTYRLAKGFGALSIASLKASVSMMKMLAMSAFKGLVGTVGLLLNPMTLLLGAGIAVVANWDRIKVAITGVVSTAPGALSSMWGRMKADAMPTLVGIKDAALMAFGGITEALQAGDMMGAANILWAGLKGVWNQGSAYLMLKWTELKAWGIDSFYAIQQAAIPIAASIANLCDLLLFDWFGIRLTDVTNAFAASWEWIKSAASLTAVWIQEKWQSAFGGMGQSGESTADKIWNAFEWLRKKLAQVMVIAMKTGSVMSKVGTLGMGGFDFDMTEAMAALEDQFDGRTKGRNQLKVNIQSGVDPDAKARQIAGEEKLQELDRKRAAHALAAKAEHALAEEHLREKLQLEKENLKTVVDETRQKRELRNVTEEVKEAAADASSSKPSGPVMPSGMTAQQQRSWSVKEQFRQRQEALATKKAAAAQKKADDLAARKEKRERLADEQQRRQAGGLIPNRELHFQEGPLFFDDEESPMAVAAEELKKTLRKRIEDADAVGDRDAAEKARIDLRDAAQGRLPQSDADRVRMELKNRVPNQQALRMSGLRPDVLPTPGSQIKVDQKAVTDKLDETNQYLVGVIASIRRLNPNFA